jgi:hypothetical protein
MSLITGKRLCTLSSGIIEAFICSGFMKCTSVTECCRHRRDDPSRDSIASPGEQVRDALPSAGGRGNRNGEMDRSCFGIILKRADLHAATTDIPDRTTSPSGRWPRATFAGRRPPCGFDRDRRQPRRDKLYRPCRIMRCCRSVYYSSGLPGGDARSQLSRDSIKTRSGLLV